jgi:hypothetical protein
MQVLAQSALSREAIKPAEKRMNVDKQTKKKEKKTGYPA